MSCTVIAVALALAAVYDLACVGGCPSTGCLSRTTSFVLYSYREDMTGHDRA